MKLIFLIIILIITVACTNITEIYDGTNGSTKIEYDVSYYDGTNGFINRFYEKEVPTIKENLKKDNSQTSVTVAKVENNKSIDNKTTTVATSTSKTNSKKQDENSKLKSDSAQTKSDKKTDSVVKESSKNSGNVDFFYPVDNFVVKNDFSDRNSGIDFGINKNTSIKASAQGIVIFSGEKNSLGKSVFIYHNGGYITIYYNLDSTKVIKGDYIKTTDQIIGTASDSFHFEIRKQDKSGISVIDPKNILKKRRK